MKTPMMKNLNSLLFLHFCGRMLCLMLFFKVVFVHSETPFYLGDSIIFIAEGAYLFKESQVDIYSEVHVQEKQYAPEKQKNTSRYKVFIKPSLSSERKCTEDKIEAASFTLPQSSLYIRDIKNSLSAAALGNSSQPKKHYKITDPIFRAFLKKSISEQKLQVVNEESLNLSKITLTHYSRPPPKI